MIRNSARLAVITALALLFSPVNRVFAQDQTPATPDAASAPAAPAAAPVFPAPDPADFTATSPTKDVVNAFMQANLGFDQNAMWQVQAIQKTEITGMSKVIVYVGDKSGKQQPYRFGFFTTPDQKHIIVGEKIISFGEHPFAANRAILQQRADGPYRGSASKDLELVEFADFQCPHCKAAQANMEKLVADFPKARIVFQNDPLPSIHPQSVTAAAYGACVAKLAGSSAFFQFAAAVFDGQDGLGTADGATLTLNSAATKAGLDPAKVSACASSPETKAVVDSSIALSKDLQIASVPTLVINGREVAANAPYETLKQIIEFQAKADGVTQ
ncbi:thioredoxin domain-containing protein [Telmatobacter sp. DSM 110680]|uniref:Thioredoxin domain-containing protein n=1 Tax=Telmatobacter sp. DSM 110680 TaxID=3036704 RepID=A0AAU7DHW9_9BACT